MYFNFKQNEVPAMAWLAMMRRGSDEVLVLHGKHVERNEGWFVSGVWAGSYAEGGFARSPFACCCGATLCKPVTCRGGGNRLIFSTHSTPLDALYSVRRDDTLFFSNSLPFLLARTGGRLDAGYHDYEYDLCSSLFGRAGFVRETRLADGNRLHLHRAELVEVDEGLNMTCTPRASGLHFRDYADYRAKLEQITSDLIANARDEGRGHRFGLITTISQGYDAPAVSAIVRQYGCREALTFNRPHPDDSGAEIARRMGFGTIHELDEHTFRSSDEPLEAEPFSIGSCSGATFGAFGPLLKGKLLFMGTRGDSIWSCHNPNVNNGLDFSYGNQLSQASLVDQEFCYRNSTVQVPLPMVGADAWEDICRISTSDEMRPWRVGGKYDRPVPRRLVEDCGIGRTMFGQAKYGAGSSLHFNTMRSLRQKMSRGGYASFADFVRRQRHFSLRGLVAVVRFYCAEAPMYINFVLRRLHIRRRMKTSGCGRRSAPLSGAMICWGVEETTKRYIQ